ncbi:MAG: nucleotidyltransferase family protein [Hydrogenophaga sp.]|nr:nucleotidyltransferase family protein [Hydrogenophaga sp.]
MTPLPDPDAPADRMALSAVVLAAGGAQRLGGRPKCLLERGGEPLVRRQVQALLDCGAGPVVVVTGCHAPSVRAAVQDQPVRVVHHPDWARGATGSVRMGLTALAGVPLPVLVALADMPAMGRPELLALQRAWHTRPAHTEVLVPMVHGERGNPVVLSAAVRDAVLTGNRWPSPRDWQTAHPALVHRWTTDNPAYRQDIDTPEDLARFNATQPLPLRWPAGWDQTG